ncbi:MAG TPA: MFS transporter [Gemmatimonadales bacterium]
MKSAPVVPRPVKGLGLVSLFNDFASEMVYPLLPGFLTRNLGAGALALGALDGAADLTSAALRWVSGRLSDRRGWQKPLILAGYGTAVLVRPIIAVASAAWQVIGLRVLDRVGKGLRTPARDALVAHLTPVPQRGRAYGFHRAADHLGAVAGSLAAWALLGLAVGVRDVIALSVVPGLLALLVLAPVLGRKDGKTEGRKEVERVEGPAVSDASGRAFWGPVLALTVLTVGRLPETLLLLRLQDLDVAIVAVPLVWAGLHVVRSLGSYPGGWLSDRAGPRATLALGGLIFAGVAGVLALPLAAGLAVIVFLALGLATGLTEGAERATVAMLAPVRTGRGFGDYQAVSGFAALPAALALGGIYQAAGGPTALIVSSALVLVGVGLWWIAARRLQG